MKLTIIRGDQIRKVHLLKPPEKIIGRASKDKSWTPDIDLWPDEFVSRKHARLDPKAGGWLISDLGSRNGTLVGDADLGPSDPPIRVPPGVPIVVGKTMLVLDPVGRHRAGWRNLSIAFDFPKAINYSLSHCSIPTLANVTVLNWGSESSKPFSLNFHVRGYSKPCAINIPAIRPGQSLQLEDTSCVLLTERLEELSERVKARIEVQADGESIYDTEIWVLGFYEWSEDSEHRKTLAAFAQPGNPIVRNIVRDAELYLDKIAGTSSFSDLLVQPLEKGSESALKALYECLCNSYHIKYIDPPVSYELRSQVIRPPHHVITGFKTNRCTGNGTCVDLTLLLASCLESLTLDPLIVLVKKNKWTLHAFAGCWKQHRAVRESVLNYDQLRLAVDKGEIVLLECTGFAEKTGKKRRYEDAVADAIAEFTAEKFLYALNIVQLRNNPVGRITPIQNAVSPDVLKILNKSKELSQEQQSRQVNTAHLLLGCITAGSDISIRLFKKVQTEEALKVIARGVKDSFHGPPKKSRNLKAVLDVARDLAHRGESPSLEEYHLLWALLHCGSAHLKSVLKSLELDLDALRVNLADILNKRGIEVNHRYDSYSRKATFCVDGETR